jgi:hypothetical protein
VSAWLDTIIREYILAIWTAAKKPTLSILPMGLFWLVHQVVSRYCSS